MLPIQTIGLNLLNTTDAEVSIKEWRISYVMEDSDSTTTPKAPKEVNLGNHFPDKKIPANGILLVAATDPAASGNDLTAGDDITKDPEDENQTGVQSLYLIHDGLALPNSGAYLLVLRNAKDKDGTSEKIVDVGGTYFAAKSDTTFNTEVCRFRRLLRGMGMSSKTTHLRSLRLRSSINGLVRTAVSVNIIGRKSVSRVSVMTVRLRRRMKTVARPVTITVL